MSNPSSLVSLRITEDDLNSLESRVGLDGSRNRSDVIRLAIHQFLQGQPLLPDMDSVRIPIGRATKMHLGQLYELQGITTETACQEGLKLYIANAIKHDAEAIETLEAALEVSRAVTITTRRIPRMSG